MEITKKADYDQTASFGQSNYTPLPKGGYVCKIFKAEAKETQNGQPMIHIAFDIAEGEYKGYFMELFQSRKQNARDKFKEVKYPFEGQAWIVVTDYEDPNKTSRKFKGFCTALEDSGTTVWNGNKFMINALDGAMVGIVYQREEQEWEGKRSWRTLPWAFRSVDTIREDDYFVPEDKALPEKTDDVMMSEGFAKVQDVDIPF